MAFFSASCLRYVLLISGCCACHHCCCAAFRQARLSALESELRKSKRAEQKLQALLYRLRQDVASMGSNPNVFDNLQDVRSLEYEVDFLANKCKVRGSLACLSSLL